MPNEKEQSPANPKGQGADTEVKENASTESGEGGGANSAQDPPEEQGPPKTPAEPTPEEERRAAVEQRILAEATREIAAAREELATKRDDVKSAYETALTETLQPKYEVTDKRFLDTAKDLMRPANGGKSRLETWVDKWLKADGELRKHLLKRGTAASALEKLRGTQELARERSAAAAARWKQAFTDWSTPQEKIAAVLASYEGRLDDLNERINKDDAADTAIYEFWFEVAPQHLQLRKTSVSSANAPGVEVLTGALGGLNDHAQALKSGADRGDGSVFLIAPADLHKHRRDVVLKNWEDAVKAAATAEAAYSLQPDDAATLKQAFDKATQDEAAGARQVFQAS